MTKPQTKTAAQLAAEIRKLQSEQRAAKKAEREASKEAFRSGSHALGEWLVGLAGATTARDVEVLKSALDSNGLRSWLEQIRAENSNSSEPETGYSEVENSTPLQSSYGHES